MGFWNLSDFFSEFLQKNSKISDKEGTFEISVIFFSDFLKNLESQRLFSVTFWKIPEEVKNPTTPWPWQKGMVILKVVWPVCTPGHFFLSYSFKIWCVTPHDTQPTFGHIRIALNCPVFPWKYYLENDWLKVGSILQNSIFSPILGWVLQNGSHILGT